MHDAGGRHAGDRDLDAVDRRERSPGGPVDDADPGDDDDRGEDRLREVLDRAREEEQDRDHGARGEQAGELGAHAHRVVHGGPRAARPDRERLRQPGRRVCHAHRQELLRRADVLPPLPRERPRGEDLVRERHEEETGGCGEELDDVAERRSGEGRAREAAFDRPDERDPVVAEVERPRDADRRGDDDQRAGRMGRNRRRQISAASATALSAMVAPLTSPSSCAISRAGRAARSRRRQPEQLGELRDHERDRDPVQVPDEHGPREVVGDPADPEQASQEKARADEQGEHRRELDRLLAPRHGERQDRGEDQGRGRALRPDRRACATSPAGRMRRSGAGARTAR